MVVTCYPPAIIDRFWIHLGFVTDDYPDRSLSTVKETDRPD